MEKIEFEIESICPLMMDNFTQEKQPTTEKEYLKQAPLKAYRDEKGNLAIPAMALKAALRDQAVDIGPKMQSKKTREKIRACLFIEPDMLSIGKKDFDCIDKRMVTRKGSGQKVTRVPSFRPLIKEWKTSGTIYIMDSLTPDFIKEALETSGFMKGVLSYRPEFGRFKVTKFKVVKN